MYPAREARFAEINGLEFGLRWKQVESRM